jgi:rRNA-processing protein FCF1
MIIIDTNILMELENVDIFQHLDEFREFGEPVILSSCMAELKKLDTKKSRFAVSAVERLCEFNPRITILRSFEKHADDAIIKLARSGKDAVVTNDDKLIKKLKLNNVKVIRLRQRKYLAFA